MIDTSIIKRFEGCFLEAYICPAGVPTIGWGATFYPDGKRVKIGDKISQVYADKMLEAEVVRRLKEMNLPDTLNDNRKAALVSFQYNLGNGAWNKSTLKRKVLSNHNDPTIRDEFMKWVNKGSKFEKGLTNRRKAEADLYFKA